MKVTYMSDDDFEDTDDSGNNTAEPRLHRWLAMLLITHTAMLAHGASIHGPGWDEAGHLPAGISHWQVGHTDLYRVNPPMPRMIATLPLALCQFDLDWPSMRESSHARPEFGLGRQLWQRHGKEVYWYLTLARWMSIPWSLLAAYIVYRWGRELYGARAGLFSAVLWCFSPLVLTNAQMITPDTAASALGVFAAYVFWKWLQDSCPSSTVHAGLLLGLAELSKFTWVVLFGLWPLLWFIHFCHSPALRSLRGLCRQGFLMGMLIAFAVLVINLGYGFEGSFARLGSYRFVSSFFRGDTAENKFQHSVLGNVPVPLPRNYVLGIDRQKLDFEIGLKGTYLRGKWREEGWYYYYAYGLFVKEPIGYILLLLIATVVSVGRRIEWNATFLLAPAVVVFALVSSQTGFNIHLRYVLPCFPFVFIWMGRAFSWALEHPWRLSIVRLLLWSAVAASVWVFPHSHSYFNSFVGGPRHGHCQLLGGNIDWGQDILVLSKWAREHPGKPIDAMAYSLNWLIDHDSVQLPDKQPPPGPLGGRPSNELPTSCLGPKPGRYAVFVSSLHDRSRQFAYFLEFEPVEVLGYTVYIYELSEEDVARYWRNQVAKPSI